MSTLPAELSSADRDRALERTRHAWQAQHPDASPSDAPTALRATDAPLRALFGEFMRGLRKVLPGATAELSDLDALLHAHAAPEAAPPGTLGALEPRGFAEGRNGFLVALWLPATTAAELAVPGGELPEALHCTLCYCGDLTDVDELTVARAIARIDAIASYHAPLDARVAGYGRFAASPTSDGQEVFYASVDAPDLLALRQEIAAELQWAGLPPLSSHGYTPHITLAYLDPAAANPVERVPSVPLRFAVVTVIAGARRIDIPLGGFSPLIYSTASHGGAWRLFNALPERFADAPAWINVLPKPGSYQHPSYGTFAITPERNARFIQNFNDQVYQRDIPITLDIEHNGSMSGGIGYFAELRLNGDGSVDARVEWTDVGRQLLAEDRFKYFSPAWWDRWNRPGTDLWFDDVLIGGAICTRPYFKDNVLAPLVASEGLIYAPESRGGGQPAQALRQLGVAATEEVAIVSDKTVTLSEADVQRFREMEAREAEREKSFAEMQAQLAAQETAKAASDAQLAALRSESQQRKFSDLVHGRGGAGDGAVWPGAIDANVTHLVALAEAVGEESDVFTHHVARMQEAAKTLKESAAFAPIGTNQGGAGGGNAWDQIEAKARVYAAEQKVTQEQAIVAVMASEPDLRKAYEAEARG